MNYLVLLVPLLLLQNLNDLKTENYKVVIFLFHFFFCVWKEYHMV